MVRLWKGISLTLSSFAFFLTIAQISALAADSAGQVVSVAGKVLIRPEGKDAATAKQLKAGDFVREGDVINTSSDGAAKILLQDKTIVDIGPSALFHVQKFAANHGADRNVDLKMNYGTLRVSVTKKLEGKGSFKVRTQSATMGVRGTEFVVKSEESKTPGAKTEITVVQGKVDVGQTHADGRSVASVKPVSLTAGQKIESNTATAMASKPVNLSSDQMKAVVSSAKVEDNTFHAAIAVNTGGSSSMGAATQQIIKEAVASQVASTQAGPQIRPGDAGFIGAFGANQAFTPPPVHQTPRHRNARVVITGL